MRSPTESSEAAAEISGDRPTASGAAFFDLDRTLLDVNSAILFAKYEFREGRLSAFRLAQSFLWSMLYHLSLLDLETTYERAMQTYLGADDDELTVRTGEWFKREVAHRIQPGARAALRIHRDLREPCVLLTNTSCYLAKAACDEYELDGWLANMFPTDDRGRLTGEFEKPLCFGAGKVTRAEYWAEENNIDLAASTFYTDSLSDLPMLERVGRPRVVNPDPRLRRAAKRRGWPILDWSTELWVTHKDRKHDGE